MAKRDMRKIIEQTRLTVAGQYDMRAGELVELGEMAKEKPVEAVGEAFLYGYAMGQRALKAEQKTKSPTCEGAQAGQATNQAQ